MKITPSANNPPSRKRRKLLLTALIAVAIFGLAWFFLHTREPVIQGKPVSVWVNGLYVSLEKDSTGTAKHSDDISPVTARQVLKSLGSNAVPYLVEVLNRKEGRFQEKYRNVWFRLPAYAQRIFPRPVNPLALQFGILQFLSEIGENARPAIPALINLLKSDNESVRGVTIDCLADIGKGDKTVTEALVKALNDPSVLVRWDAADALKRLDPEAAARAGIKPPPPPSTNTYKETFREYREKFGR
jgi:HEAT repeats